MRRHLPPCDYEERNESKHEEGGKDMVEKAASQAGSDESLADNVEHHDRAARMSAFEEVWASVTSLRL